MNNFEFWQIILIVTALLTGIILVAVTPFLFGLVFKPLFSGFGKLSERHTENKLLLTTGEAGVAGVLSVKKTGFGHNKVPEYKISLRVQTANRPAYQAEAFAFIRRYNRHQVEVGKIVPVKVNPNNLQKVVIDIDLSEGLEF